MDMCLTVGLDVYSIGLIDSQCSLQLWANQLKTVLYPTLCIHLTKMTWPSEFHEVWLYLTYVMSPTRLWAVHA